MIKDIYDYFENLDNKNLPKEDDSILLDGDRIRHIYRSSRLKPNLTVDGTPYFAKSINEEYTAYDLATINMYNHIGIPAVPSYILKEPTSSHDTYQTISQDICSVKDFMFTLARKIIKTPEIINYRNITNYKWAIINDPNLREIFLQHMTPECLDALSGLYLIDELRTDGDRHEDNYFFYKHPDDQKFTGIIAIDNELGDILWSKPTTKELFNEFLLSPYFTYSPIGCVDQTLNYATRIKNIKKLINDGSLTPQQIELINKALAYDFPKEILKICKHPRLKNYQTSTYDTTSQLWEYNRKELENELNI